MQPMFGHSWLVSSALQCQTTVQSITYQQFEPCMTPPASVGSLQLSVLPFVCRHRAQLGTQEIPCACQYDRDQGHHGFLSSIAGEVERGTVSFLLVSQQQDNADLQALNCTNMQQCMLQYYSVDFIS